MPNRTYHGLVLDPFQEQALNAIDMGYSVIVSAPTGSGKTLVADYLVEQAFKQNLQVIYTAPIKALSNQKYKDFKAQFGEEAIGIMTGDVVLNPDAPLLVMTTEIFRNQVITEDPSLRRVSYVIFDEIHWLNDEERGTVWEESIILAPGNIRILGLSATIANAAQLAQWIETIRGQPVVLVEEHRRVVPLEYYYFTKETGITTYEKLWKFYHKERKKRLAENVPFAPSTHLDLIQAIEKDYLPALYFVFSRKQCAEKARELASKRNYLSPAERSLVQDLFHQHFGPEEDWSPSTQLLFRLSSKGIAFHHAGLLPLQKVVVEELFLKRLIKVLYCTETFSVGINYPVKSVCFDSLNKFDGIQFRPLENHEFFQMSGRAGRRGIDEKGYSFVLVDLNYMEREPIPKFNIKHLEPLTSQFKLSYNTVLNLSASLNREQIERYFQKSFAAYTYLQDSQHIKDQLAIVEEELKTLRNTICEHHDSIHCPLKFQPKFDQLKRLRRVYNSLSPRRQKKIYGREMLKKIKNLERLLQHPPRRCPSGQKENCRQLSPRFYQLQHRKTELEKALLDLPDESTFIREFDIKQNHLRQLGYMRGDQLLPRGEFARRIYVQELLVTELVFSDIFFSLDDDQLCALISSIDYESRKNDVFQKATVLDWAPVKEIADFIRSICGPQAVRYDPRVAVIVYHWSRGSAFAELKPLSNLDEGDIISVIRRTIDLFRQIRDATSDTALKQRITQCMKKLDRDEASLVEL